MSRSVESPVGWRYPYCILHRNVAFWTHPRSHHLVEFARCRRVNLRANSQQFPNLVGVGGVSVWRVNVRTGSRYSIAPISTLGQIALAVAALPKKYTPSIALFSRADRGDGGADFVCLGLDRPICHNFYGDRGRFLAILGLY